MLRDLLLTAACLVAALWLIFTPRDRVKVNCSLSEIHQDLVKYRDAGRGAR